MFQIDFYAMKNGDEPAKDFLLSLPPKMRAKMLRTIDLLARNGNELREPYSKPLRNGIMELRAKVGSDISHVLYFFVVGQRAILTHGFIKKTNRPPLLKSNVPSPIGKIFLKGWMKNEQL